MTTVKKSNVVLERMDSIPSFYEVEPDRFVSLDDLPAVLLKKANGDRHKAAQMLTSKLMRMRGAKRRWLGSIVCDQIDHLALNHLQRLLLQVCKRVIDRLRVDPDVVAYLDRRQEQDEWVDVWILEGRLRNRFEPQLRELLRQWASRKGFNGLLEQIGEDALPPYDWRDHWAGGRK
jgi:hypothetical protein